jgi:hypothetical protein
MLFPAGLWAYIGLPHGRIKIADGWNQAIVRGR